MRPAGALDCLQVRSFPRPLTLIPCNCALRSKPKISAAVASESSTQTLPSGHLIFEPTRTS